jgi:hypothetical protein
MTACARRLIHGGEHLHRLTAPGRRREDRSLLPWGPFCGAAGVLAVALRMVPSAIPSACLCGSSALQ